ncbi:MAG: type II toxin-antitoxin system Phd/YefM family antitoxin [Actinobacteria bacterium]|nr:type II toxin-antitoxin system Phd/YefM family antitoxin [Actinomycetota bacterium]
MNFISVRELRNNPAKIWEKLKKDNDIIITSNGKPIAILNSIDNNEIETTLEILQRLRAIRALEDIQADSVKRGLDKMSDKEINDIVKKVRRECRK